MGKKITLSVIKADVGGYVGHSSIHPALLKKAEERLAQAKKDKLLIDYCRSKVGDDIALIMTHQHGVDSVDIHRFAWETFEEVTKVSKEYGQYGAGQDLLADAFAGNITGMGPGVAEIEFVERESEPVLVFLSGRQD